MIDVSIIIPTYNRLWSLVETIASCKNTTCSTEIIVIDDGSTDGTADWLKKQPDLIVISQPNLGKCAAVNKGFDFANGKYVRFLDSDDFINPNANDEQFLIAEKTGSDIVVSGLKLINITGEVLETIDWYNCDDFISQQLGECFSSHYSAYLFRKSILEDLRHNEDFRYRDDRLFILEVALKKPKISIHLNHALYHRIHTYDKLQHPSGKNHSIQNIQHLNIYKEILYKLELSNELTTRRKNASARILWNLARWISKYNLTEGNKVRNWVYELNPKFDVPEKFLMKIMYNFIGFKNTEILLRIRRFIRNA